MKKITENPLFQIHSNSYLFELVNFKLFKILINEIQQIATNRCKKLITVVSGQNKCYRFLVSVGLYL